ncbi:MAG TPA: phosphate ABC transporter substrate-binding protein PstS, partial [Anaerolineaceae bacterium]|nr:phosphate ABC transporter substrate-binding protein PstS [Anaerolineaceae bacterium]
LFVLLLGSLALTACAPAAATPAAPAATQPPQIITQIVAGTPQTIVITATPAPVPTTLAAGSVTINAGGATFPLPLYTEWTYAYQFVDPSVLINYQGIGSGGGKSGIIANTLDFAGSDSLLTDQNYTDGKDLQMYPVVAGAVVPIYNIAFTYPKTGANTPTPAPAPTLVLDRTTLVGIYNATIKNWNDPAIVKLNPGLASLLPAKPITVVHRSDGSGTTEIFTKALTSFSPDWKAGGAQSVEWPVDKAGNGIGGKGNPGVAAAVLNTPNSIGYVELDYAIANSIAYAQMVNKAGQTVTANAASLQSAMADFSTTFTPQLTNTIVDGPGAGSWPISGYTYYILHTTSMPDCTKASKIVEYMKWTLTAPAAAQAATKLGYSVLPADVQKNVLAKLAQVTCKGNPVQ